MKLNRLDQFALVVILGQAALVAYIYLDGKAGPLPMHFGLNGQVDRWGDRRELAIVAGGMTALNAVLYAVLPALARGRGVDPSNLGMSYARATLLAVTSILCLMFGAMGLGLTTMGGGPMIGRVMMGFLALVVLTTGAFVGKAAPNPFVGVRTFWALRSRLAWDRSNRLLGRLWFWLGLAALVAVPIAPQPLGALILAGLMIASALAAVFESWRVWRSDPDRLAS